MVAANEITDANRTAVVLSQNRIKDEALIDAMNRLGNTELEKLTINKRFGTIVVNKKLLAKNDVEKALIMQKEEVAAGKQRRFIGEILKANFGLTEGNVIDVLQEQKKYEKNRLNLEKTLNKFNAEIEIIKRVSSVMEETVSKDKLEAFICLKLDLNTFIGVDHIRVWLKKQGVVFGIVDDSKIKEFIEHGFKGNRLKVAKGLPPLQGKDGAVEFYFDTEYDRGIEEREQDEKSSHVKKGEILAKRTPSEKGKPGRDVFGHFILPAKVKEGHLGCGNGVFKDNELRCFALVDGTPILYKGRTIFVKPSETNQPTHIIPGNVDSNTGDIDVLYNIVVEGTIQKGGIVKCHQLIVENNILGNVKTTGDIEVKNGIGETTENRQDSDLLVDVKANGNITVKKHIVNANIKTNGHLRSATKYVKSSIISARNEISLRNVYSENDHPTILRIGIVEDNYELSEIESKIKERTGRLKDLKCEQELDVLEKNLYKQIQVQDGLREQQNALKFLLETLEKTDLNELQSLEKTIFMMRECPDKDTKAYQYLSKTVKSFATENPTDCNKHIQKLLKENQENYRIAVEAVQRLENEYSVKQDQVNEIIKKSGPELEKIEMEIENLIIEKDGILLTQEKYGPAQDAVIKVKNQISQGTVIEGPHSRMILDKTLFGVKLWEEQNTITKEWAIKIEGYYE